VIRAQPEVMQDQLEWALGCALLWALGSSLWILGLALLALYAVLHALEKSRRFRPVSTPSSLWRDLDKLTLEDLDQAVRESDFVIIAILIRSLWAACESLELFLTILRASTWLLTGAIASARSWF